MQMIKLGKKSQSGITLVTLTIAIIIMLIITSTLIYNIATGNKVKALNNMYYDIVKIKDKVDLYYASYNTIPIEKTPYENIGHLLSINPNDNNKYYVVDLEALPNMTLKYGKDYKTYKANPLDTLTDIYVINERSHSVYYVKGITFENTTYYTTPQDTTKVETSAIFKIEIENKDEHKAILKISAVDKTNGIKQITLFVNERQYKTYDYTSGNREVKQEMVQLPIEEEEEYSCYIQVIDEEGDVQNSDVIMVKENP